MLIRLIVISVNVRVQICRLSVIPYSSVRVGFGGQLWVYPSQIFNGQRQVKQSQKQIQVGVLTQIRCDTCLASLECAFKLYLTLCFLQE